VHRTFREAARNLQRLTDFHILGPECRVEYARSRLAHSNDQQDFHQKKVVVRQIPENVHENDLRHLFVNCRVIEYCPARTVQLAITTMKTKDSSKVLWGYELLAI